VADFIGETNFMEGEVLEADAAKTTVGLGSGVQILTRPIEGLSVGQTVTVAVRPEKISLSRTAPLNGASVPAVLDEAVYIGTDTRYTARIAERHLVVARVQNVGSMLGGDSFFQRGDQVYLSWPTESAMVLVN
jgi:spermidine/putrescine transport system ATP-binding protein